MHLSGTVYTVNAVVDATEREKAWHRVVLHFPDAEELFVREMPATWWPEHVSWPSAAEKQRPA